MAGPTSFPSWGSGGTPQGADSTTSFPDWSAFDEKPTKKKKPKKKSWVQTHLLEPQQQGGIVGVSLALLEEALPGKAKVPARVARALVASPYEVSSHPKAAAKGTARSVIGIPEGAAALYDISTPKKGQWAPTAAGISKASAVLGKGIIADYKRRYGKNWEEEAAKDPVANFWDALLVLGAGARAAALVGAASRLTEAGVARSGSALLKEMAQPGLVSEGVARTRRIEFHPPGAEKPEVAHLPYSKSPLRQYSQQFLDAISQQHPEMPIYGARARTTRAFSRELPRFMDRMLGSIVGADSLDRLPEAGRTRLYYAAQLGDHSDEGLRRFRDALVREHSTEVPEADANFQDLIRQAKQQGFGKKMVERLDKAIAYTPDEHYYRAEHALVQATQMSEQVIADANGFANITNDLVRARHRLSGLTDPASIDAQQAAIDALEEELAGKRQSLTEMFSRRRNLVKEYGDANTYVDVPERGARLTEMQTHPNFGPEKADWAIRFLDGIANATGDPAEFWRTRVGMPSGEPVQQFMQRASDAFFQTATSPDVSRRVVENTLGLGGRGERTNVYYSQLQRVLADPRVATRMPAQQFMATLEKAVKPMDWENSGLDLWFEQFKPNEMVGKQQVIDHLTIPLNAYDLEEVYLVNDFNLPREMQTRWSAHGNGSLLSRDPATGEYREIVMKMPGDVQGRGIFTKAHTPETQTWGHWKMDDVAFHIRFHVFEEDGVKKLLVEEIQSDWESEFRKQGLKKHEIAPLEPEAKARLAEIQSRVDDVYAQMDQLFAEGHAWSDDFNQLEREASALEAEEQQHGLLRPSPLGPRYYQAALRRVMREAAEEGVDQVILIDHRVQTARNQYGHAMLDQDGSRAPQDVVAYHDLHSDMLEGAETYRRIYAKDHPEFLSKEYKQTPGHNDAAYQGRFSAQDRTGIFSAPGDMPGTVMHMTPEVKAQALQPSPLFQKQPNWDAVPKGATEFLANGDRLIHLFKDADISTVIHELAHSAVFDLSGTDRKILEDHYGAGMSIEQWKETAHENYARDFELWAREGHAPNAHLQRIFTRISAWMREIVKAVDPNHEIPQEVKDVFGRMFVNRDDIPDIFIPHRATAPDLGGGRTSRGIPRADREIGDNVKSRIPLFKKNRLGLMRGGLLNDDPRVLMEHLHRVMMLARANQLREAVMEMSKPLMPGDYPDFETQYVVKRAGRGVDKPTFDALEEAEDPQKITDAISAYLDDHITDDSKKFEAWQEEHQLYTVDKKTVDLLFKNVTGKKPGATTGPKSSVGRVGDALLDATRAMLLYANPGFYMANMVGNAWMTAVSDPRAFRYFKWSMENAITKASGKGKTDPFWEQVSTEMGRGPTSGQLSANEGFISQTLKAKGNRGVAAAETVGTNIPRWWGSHAGRVIDDSFRVGAWRQAAKKHGYKTKEEQQKLLSDAAGERGTKWHKAESKARKDLNAIRDEAENLMLDFDSMTPFERTYLMRAIFLYPFLRASVKYPAMFMGERPMVAAGLGMTGEQGAGLADQTWGPRSEDMPLWTQGYARIGQGRYLNVGAMSPIAPFLGIAESGLALPGMATGKPPPVGINRPFSYINPMLQLMWEASRGQNKYGRDTSWADIFGQEAPLPGYLSQAAGLREPSTQYSDRDLWATILRSFRVIPFGMGGQASPSAGFPQFPEFPNAR